MLVVDNGSTGSTEEMVKSVFKGCGYLNLGANQGFAKAANVGIQESSTPFLALLNDDTEADPLWVEVGLKAFHEQREYAFFASRMVRYYDRNRLDSAGDCYSATGLPYKRGLDEPLERFRRSEPVLGASAGAAFFRRFLFNKVGLFDEDYFMYLEDVELSLRAQCAGLRCLYLPDAVVYHIEAASDPDRKLSCLNEQDKGTVVGGQRSARQPVSRSAFTFYSKTRVYWITRNRWQLMVTYQPLRHFPWLLYGWTRSALFHLLKAGFFGSFLRGLFSGVACTPIALKKRIAFRRNRVISTRQLCRLLHRC